LDAERDPLAPAREALLVQDGLAGRDHERVERIEPGGGQRLEVILVNEKFAALLVRTRHGRVERTICR
jgi:hypothetical protein